MKKKHLLHLFWLAPLIIGLFFFIGWITQSIWNATITEIFDSNPISYWQAILLIILFKILTGHNYSLHQKKTDKSAKNLNSKHVRFFHKDTFIDDENTDKTSCFDEEKENSDDD